MAKASVTFTTEGGGTYIAVATLTDAPGANRSAACRCGPSTPAMPVGALIPISARWSLVPDKDTYAPGDTAEILVQSPFAQPVQAWLTIERGNLIEQRVVTVDGSTVLQIPITPEFAPNVHVIGGRGQAGQHGRS